MLIILLQVLMLFVQAKHVFFGIERIEEHCSSLPFNNNNNDDDDDNNNNNNNEIK
jgi:hypothetical protein